MTIISTFYDSLVAKCVATWPTAKQIANALDVGGAASTLLQDGFAIAFGPAQPPQVDLESCQMLENRTVLIMRTLLAASTENDTTKTIAATKAILEERFKIVKALRLDNSLSGVVSDIKFDSDGGIELLATVNEAGRFFIISTIFTVAFVENLLS